MKNVIITGSTGFIGFQLVKRLSDNDCNVFAVVRDSHYSHTIFRGMLNVFVIQCDMERISELPSILHDPRFSKYDFDVFFHLGWNASAGSGRSDYATQVLNVKQACDAVAVASLIGCTCFVGAGSIMEDECEAFVLKDGTTPNANYHYSAAKLSAHLMCKIEAARLNMKFFWGKISNAYGETDRTLRFINLTLNKMLNNEPCELSACNQWYDFIYVTEVARALECIALNGIAGRSYYIGSFESKPLKFFVERMRVLSKSESELLFGAIDFNGCYLDKSFFDANPLYTDTGFKSEIPFDCGIVKTIEWLKNERGV